VKTAATIVLAIAAAVGIAVAVPEGGADAPACQGSPPAPEESISRPYGGVAVESHAWECGPYTGGEWVEVRR
jgi:hypothetical protein